LWWTTKSYRRKCPMVYKSFALIHPTSLAPLPSPTAMLHVDRACIYSVAIFCLMNFL
jgi:hypothetical protein